MLRSAVAPVRMRALPVDEAGRNALLRRVDWRFLLPDANPAITVYSGRDRLLEAALAALTDRVVYLNLAPSGAADLAVLVDPDAHTLRAASNSLRRGAACYVEWTSPLSGGPRAARRRLADAGFVEATCYWSWPMPGRDAPRYWVPLDAGGAQANFLATRPTRPGVVSALRRRSLMSAWRIAFRTGAIAPVCAIAHKPSTNLPAAGWNGINHDVARMLSGGWSRWGLGPPPRTLSWLLLTGGEASFNKVVGLVLADDERQPRVAVKLSRCPTSDTGLLREAHALELIAAERPALQGVPRVVFRERFGAALALCQTVVRGRPLEQWLRRGNLRDLALAVTDWFCELAGRSRASPAAEWRPRLVEPTLNGFAGLAGPAVVPELVARTRRLFASFDELPLTISHGDAGPSNVLMDECQRISVIDWEDFEPRGLPVGDLSSLLTLLFFHLENPWHTGRFREVYRATLDPTTNYGRVRAECFARYASRVGVQPALVSPLSLVPWMQRSLREHQGMRDATLGAEGRDAFSRGLYVTLWQEHLRTLELGSC